MQDDNNNTPLAVSNGVGTPARGDPLVQPSPADVERFARLLEESAAENLDEVVAEPVTVAFREWTETTDHDTQETRRTSRVRHAQIETYVPMRIFNAAMADSQRTRAQQLVRGASDESGSMAVLESMARSVLSVWQLTEPQMTLDRLQDGLTFGQIQGLYGRFFGAEIRRLSGRAQSA